MWKLQSKKRISSRINYNSRSELQTNHETNHVASIQTMLATNQKR